MKKTLTVLVVIAFFISIGSGTGSVAPNPYCLSQPLYHQFPLTKQQILTHDMADSFTGYNLDIQLSSKNSFATMTQKLTELDRKNVYLSTIISHYIEKKGNSVGEESFILYKDMSGSVHFTYGRVNSKTQLPEMNSTVVVHSDKNVQCFDAALFMDFGIAIVDCIRRNTDPDEPFTNLFYYLDLALHNVKKIVQNDVYIDFGDIYERKLIKMKQPKSHQTYLIRSYFAKGVKKSHDNTYLDIYAVLDPENLQNIGVVDRTFLHEKTLQIADIQVYNGHIFILDSNYGLHRLMIARDHKIYIRGAFKQRGMQRFSIYSDDLEDQLIMALANSHNIYEVDWSNTFQAKTINKYTMMENSIVQNLKINKKYVVVQSKALGYDPETNKTAEVDYTWVFTKGSRTYRNAYHIIDHNSSKVQIDFDQHQNHVYTADESGLALYKLDQARLHLHFIDDKMIGQEEMINITATSKDVRTNKTLQCNVSMKAIFVDKQERKIFETGYEMNTQFSTNYPGQLHIPLSRRFMGPNITYTVEHLTSEDIPQHWVNKMNRTFVNMNTTVRVQDITFFHTDMLQQYGRQLLIYYFEDTKNDTHVAECIHTWEDQSINCAVVKQYHHESRISSFTTAYVTNEEGWEYYYVFTQQGEQNVIDVIDFVRHKLITRIEYEGHQEAVVHDLASSNGFLYVLRRNVKTIDVYSLTRCQQEGKCTIEFSITHDSLQPLGISYFAPEYIQTDSEHPEILFIKCLGSVLILDIDNKEHVQVIDEISKSQAVKDPYFRIAVNKYRMVLTAQPNIIEEYSLEDMYHSNTPLPLMKNYPMYGYRIQPNSDIEFSDRQFLVYVNAYDPVVNVSVILVYQSGHPASIVLYDTIYLDKLYSRPGFQVQVSGLFVDFVSIASGDQFHCYRVFEQPSISLNNTFTDYSLNIKGNNTFAQVQTNPINVSVVNYPSDFKPTKLFNDTLSNLKIKQSGSYKWQDRKWFDGHVLNYAYQCEECPINDKGKPNLNPKVKLRQHIDDPKRLQVQGNDFIQTSFGGIGVYQDLFKFMHNGSVSEIINLPDQKLLENCLKVASFQTGDFVITACQQLGRGINLYMTSLQSFKPITDGPFVSEAYHARTLQVVHDVVMIVDQNAYPDLKLLPGSVFLYRVSVNPDTLQQFQFLEQFDNNDLLAAHGWTHQTATIANAHLTHSVLSDTFRLYITELNNGFFVIDFTRHLNDPEITVLSVRYVDMNELLKKNKLHMPTDATFGAITFTGIESNEHTEMEYIVISTKKYHTFEVAIVYDQSDQIVSTVLHRVYYRYGYYETYNEIKAINGYLAIGYVIPSIYAWTDNVRQYVAVYDTSDYPHQYEKGYSQRYMLGAYPVDHRDPSVFAFNKTYDSHSNGSRIGLIVSQPSKNNMVSTSLSKTLQVQTEKGFKEQSINITAYNDFKKYEFKVDLVDHDDDIDEAAWLTIVIILAGVLLVFFACYLCSVFNSKKGKRPQKSNQRQSLLTENDSFVEQNMANNNSTTVYNASVVSNNSDNAINKSVVSANSDIPNNQNQYQPPQMVREEDEDEQNQDDQQSSDSQEQSSRPVNNTVDETYQPDQNNNNETKPQNESEQKNQNQVSSEVKLQAQNNEVKAETESQAVEVVEKEKQGQPKQPQSEESS